MEMSELIQLDNLSLDALTELAKESFADCQDALRVYLDNERKLKRFGSILIACREKVPHGKWQQWVLETFAGHLSIRAVQLWIAEAQEPEKRQKRLDDQKTRDQKTRTKAQSFALLPEQPPAPPVSSGVIRNENPPTPAPPTRLERPAWLADPDEMGMPDVDAMPQLPKTNTHHTAANRRTPDARDTDRVGLVSPDDPRTVQDGHWYAWSEERNRLLPVSDEDILRRADEIRGQTIVEHAVTTTPVAEHKSDSVSSKSGKVPTLSQLRLAVEGKTDWTHALRESARDWAAYKMTLAGKDKIRSMESWQKALTRMGNVARDRSVVDVCEAIEKAIANGWTGWEHLEASGGRGGSRISTAVRSNRNWDEEIPEWKPTE
jgi:hypothetical protein